MTHFALTATASQSVAIVLSGIGGSVHQQCRPGHTGLVKAVTRTRYGPPSVLSVDYDAPMPTPGADEMLVRVRATTVNRTDCGILLGKPAPIRLFTGLRYPRHLVTGTDFAGIVEDVGSDVDEFAVGDRVWGFNDNGVSSQAQYMTVSKKTALARIPDGVDFVTAAASAEGASYAMGFMRRSRYTPGQRVCVYGATGAIGSAMVQLMADAGSDVTAFAPPQHLDLVAGLGAAKVIDYTTTSPRELHDRFDLVFDTVGKLPFTEAKHLIAATGRYGSSEVGPHGENLYLPMFTRLRTGPRVDLPVPSGLRQAVQSLTQLLAEDRFHPVIDTRFAMAEAVAAYEYVLTGQKVGNVILDIP